MGVQTENMVAGSGARHSRCWDVFVNAGGYVLTADVNKGRRFQDFATWEGRQKWFQRITIVEGSSGL